jgi:transposase
LHSSHGWSARGTKIYAAISGRRYGRQSFIAAQCKGKITAPFCYKGACTAKLFDFWVEHFLLPVLKPGQIVILDNATFHKSEKTRELIEKSKCSLLFLPPYSPDLNPIESFWAILKNRITHNLKTFPSLSMAIDAAFKLYDCQLE